MLSENFDLRCPADGATLSDYFLYRKTGLLRSNFAQRSTSVAEVHSYRPIVQTEQAKPKPVAPPAPRGIGGFRFNFDFSGFVGSSAAKPATVPTPSTAASSGTTSTANNSSPKTPESIPTSTPVEHKQYGPLSSFGDRMIQSMSVAKKLKGHNGCINSIEYNENASLLITGSDDLRVKLYDTCSWKQLASITTEHAANIFSAIMMPDGTNQNILSCGLDGAICASNLVTGTSSIIHRSRFVMATKLMPIADWGSGHVAIAGFESGDIAFVDSRTKSIPHKAALFHARGGATQRIPVNAIASHPHNSNLYAFASDIPFAQLCDIRYLADTSLENCKPRCAFTEVGVTTNRLRNRGIGGLGFSESGDRLLLNYKDSDLYGVEWLRLANEPSTQFQTTELQAAFSAVQTTSWDEPTDFTTSLNAAYNNAEVVSDNTKNSEFVVCYQERKNRVTMFKEATYLFEDRYVCTGSDDGHVYFWNSDSGKLVHKTRGDRNIVNGVLYHPRLPTTLAVCGIDSDVKIIVPSGSYLSGASFSPSTTSTAPSRSEFPVSTPLRDLTFEDTNNINNSSPTSTNDSNDPRRARLGALANAGTPENNDDEDDDEWIDPENDSDEDDDDNIEGAEARALAQAMAMVVGMSETNPTGNLARGSDAEDDEEDNDNAIEEDWEDIEDDEEGGDEEDDEEDDSDADEVSAVQFYPHFYDNWAQIQYACYNAFLMDRYLLSSIIDNIQKDVRAAVTKVTEDRPNNRVLFFWKENVPVTFPEGQFVSEYRQEIVPYEARLRAEFGTGLLQGMIRDEPQADIGGPDLQLDISKGIVPTEVIRNSFTADYTSLKSEYDHCYHIMAMTSLVYSSEGRLRIPSLGSEPTAEDVRGPDVEYIDTLTASRRRANQIDPLLHVIPNHEMPALSVVIEKFLSNCRIILEEIIRLFCTLKHRDGKTIDLTWEAVQYGSLLSTAPARRTIAERATFWPSQAYEVDKIHLLLKLLDSYLMPAVRFSCCSSKRQTQLMLYVTMNVELQIYFGIMTRRPDGVLGGVYFAKRLLSRLNLPSLNRTQDNLEEPVVPGTETFIVDSLYLWSLLQDSAIGANGAFDVVDPASVSRSIRAHVARIQAAETSRSRNSSQSSRLQAVKNLLHPFIDNGTLTNVFEERE